MRFQLILRIGLDDITSTLPEVLSNATRVSRDHATKVIAFQTLKSLKIVV